MRVAVVAEWYPSPGDPVLGIWAHRQAIAARDAGAEVRVLALRRPIPPLSVARQVFHLPPAIGALSGWIALAGLSLVVLIAAMTGMILLLMWRLGVGKPVRAVPPGQDVLGAA